MARESRGTAHHRSVEASASDSPSTGRSRGGAGSRFGSVAPRRAMASTRPIWKGNLVLGLVTIPIELHTAVRSHRPRLRLLHASDKSPILFERVCEREGRPVAWKDLVKGFEYEKGKFVVVTPDDFRAASIERSKSIDIVDFVKASEIDVRYFETPYYVLPAEGGERAHALLGKAIASSGRVGIGKIVFRDAQHLAAVTAFDGAMVVNLLRFADEVADLEPFRAPAQEVRPKELELAEQLIESLADAWKPEKYADEFQKNLMRILDAKVKGRKPDLEAPEEPREAHVVDLMDRLRRSLEGHRAEKKGRPGRAARATRVKSAKKRAPPRHVA
jgi:DNA end-binding protein Ku